MKNKNVLFQNMLVWALFLVSIGLTFHLILSQPVCDMEVSGHAKSLSVPKMMANLTVDDVNFTLKAQVYCIASTQAMLALKAN